LVVGAAVVGLALAVVGVRTLQAAAPPGIPRLDELQLDARVLIFTGSVSILGGLLFAIVPAWKTSRSDPAEALKQGGRTGSEGLRLSRARRTFVVAECALAVALLAGAGLLLKSFLRVEALNPGFEGKQVLLVRVTSARLSREMIDRIASLPGVQAVGAIGSFEPRNPDIAITAEGQPSLRAPLASERVTAGFFQAMSVPLRKGRHFTDEDRRANVAMINETMAKTFWPQEDPIGRRFKRGASESTSPWTTVVGVVGDMRRRGLERDVVSEFYEPETEPSMELAIRTAIDPLGHVASLRQVIRSFDEHAVVGRVTTVENHLEELGAARRFQTWLIAVFAGLGLVLSAIGIYGVMHYAVAQRTHEMGIRIALGAGGAHVLWLVIGEGLRLALIGVAAGLLAALQLTGVMAHLLFEVSSTDPAIFAIVPVMLVMVAVLACYLPARRASKVDPIVALRYE
jgi:putative ABC transport system permease protein